VTFELDATRLRARAREVGGSTYAALAWAFRRKRVVPRGLLAGPGRR
jgi:hypothetical protein